METNKAPGARLHGVLHRLPGMPPHAQGAELNSNAAAAQMRARARNRPLRNTPLRNPDGHHARPPRLLAGWQEWLGRRFGQGHDERLRQAP